MAEHIFARCEWCGKDFEYERAWVSARARKYCCQTCGNKAQVEMRRFKRATFLSTPYKPLHKLEDTMKELHKQGYKDSDYAELQKKKTLDLVGRVRV